MTYIYQTNNNTAALCDIGMPHYNLSEFGAPSKKKGKKSGKKATKASPGAVINVAGGILIRGDQPYRPSGHKWDPIMHAVAYVETGSGGYNIVNMYDAGILSWGILQWTFHQGSLQKLLEFIKGRIGTPRFRQLFPGLDIVPVKGRPEPDLVVNGTVRRVSVAGEIANAIQPNMAHWAKIFYAAGKDRTIQGLQNEYAILQLNELLKRYPHSMTLVKKKFGKKARFASIGQYLGTNIKGLALFFSMWVNNPSWAFRKFAEAVGLLAKQYEKGYDPSTWPAGWETQLADQFEKVLRATTVGYWGDAKSKKAKRVSRTQKTLTALAAFLKANPATPVSPANPQPMSPFIRSLFPAPIWQFMRPGSAGPAGSARPAGSAPPATVQGLGFTPVPVEMPGGGRIKNKKEPTSAEIVYVTGVGGRHIPIHRLAATAWGEMVNAARMAGFPAPLLLPTSGYRSVAHQTRIWKAALARYGSETIARQYVAKPGFSAHHSGRAMDLWLGINNDSTNIPKQRQLPIYRWLVANAHKFGFYPYDAEPWHWEYNPPARKTT